MSFEGNQIEVVNSQTPLNRMLLLRLRYISAKVNRMLKRTVKPRSAPEPIQNQFFSGKTSMFLSTATPNGVVLSEACS
jgi:hypothetical protein